MNQLSATVDTTDIEGIPVLQSSRRIGTLLGVHLNGYSLLLAGMRVRIGKEEVFIPASAVDSIGHNCVILVDESPAFEQVERIPA